MHPFINTDKQLTDKRCQFILNSRFIIFTYKMPSDSSSVKVLLSSTAA